MRITTWKYFFCVWLFVTACFAKTDAPITIGYSVEEMKEGAGSEDITLLGTLTKDWKLKLDHPIAVYNLEIKKKFETVELDLINNDCKNCDENWIGSHLKFTGTLDGDSHDPLKAVFWIDHLEGKPQPLFGPIYHATGTIIQLKGRLFLLKCKEGEGPVLELDQPINIDREGEFEGPLYGVKQVQLIGLDSRKELNEGPVEISGALEYGLNHGNPYEDHLCLERPVLIVDEVKGAKDGSGNPTGVRKILINSDRAMLKTKDGRIQKVSEKNGIYVQDVWKTDYAYEFFQGEKKLTIPKSGQKGAYEKFVDFFGIK